jgi:predicted MPP superfamily phosphohydrolase
MENKINRRDFLKVGLAALTGGLAASTIYVYLNNESQHVVVERVTIPIKNLGAGLDGFRIAQISDIHLYPLTKPELVAQAVDITNALKPDLVVLTGDYVWREEDAVFELTPILARLNASQGVYSIWGNHDLWTDVNVVGAAFERERLPVLVNQGVPISAGKDSFYLAGLDDGWSGEPDLDAALADMDAEMPVVLLMHEPDLADRYSVDGRVSLQLSGHSHGGQIRFPFVGAVVLPYLAWKYDMGLYRVNEMWLYTNRGLGVTNEPFRFNCAPEVTELTLVRA